MLSNDPLSGKGGNFGFPVTEMMKQDHEEARGIPTTKYESEKMEENYPPGEKEKLTPPYTTSKQAHEREQDTPLVAAKSRRNREGTIDPPLMKRRDYMLEKSQRNVKNAKDAYEQKHWWKKRTKPSKKFEKYRPFSMTRNSWIKFGKQRRRTTR